MATTVGKITASSPNKRRRIGGALKHSPSSHEDIAKEEEHGDSEVESGDDSGNSEDFSGFSSPVERPADHLALQSGAVNGTTQNRDRGSSSQSDVKLRRVGAKRPLRDEWYEVERSSKRSRHQRRMQDESDESEEVVSEHGEAQNEEIRRIAKLAIKSSRHLNEIDSLMLYAKIGGNTADVALRELCKVFSFLWSTGTMIASSNATENQVTVCKWLRKHSFEVEKMLHERIQGNNVRRTQQSISIYMQLVKSQIASSSEHWARYWNGKCYFRNLMRALVWNRNVGPMQYFVRTYANKYDDVRYYTLATLGDLLNPDEAAIDDESLVDVALALIEELEQPPTDQTVHNYFAEYRSKKQPPSQASAYKKQAKRALQQLFTCRLTKSQHKFILQNFKNRIIPWLHSLTPLADFVIDSLDAEGSIPLLALSGLYELMTTQNLHYPHFYQKLYSMMDDHVLHSTHRSRFFRMLNQYLDSSHLPAALVASFIKRLARLALHGPPAAIVVTVPWTYNLLKMHPQCTFLLHREPSCHEERQLLGLEGFHDSFDEREADPMETGAIETCLWELEELTNHYHPNVASLCKIISQEFRKQSYNLEDFLDHSYNTLVAGDLGKTVKKAPVVEYQIPKQPLTNAESNCDMVMLLEEARA